MNEIYHIIRNELRFIFIIGRYMMRYISNINVIMRYISIKNVKMACWGYCMAKSYQKATDEATDFEGHIYNKINDLSSIV